MAAAPLFDIKDRAYIVTGAGRGIGAELAAGLAEAGIVDVDAVRAAIDGYRSTTSAAGAASAAN